jgi:hypothetical protein
MSRKTSNKVAPGQGARAAPAATGGLRRFVLGNAAALAISPLLGLYAGFMLLFGGIFLAVSWQVGAEPLIDHYRYAPYTARVPGRIVESWAALEFDPDRLPAGKLYWQPYARIANCAVVEYAGDWGAPLHRAFCGNRFEFRDDFRLDDWHTLAPGIPFSYARDASGFEIEEIRVSRAARDWLAAHPPHDTFMLSKPAPTTALGALQAQLDRPFDVAMASWTTPPAAIPLAYDPRHPDAAMPAHLVDSRRGGFWFGGLIFAVLFAIPGVLVWRLGIGLLFFGQPASIQWLLTVLPLLALPWWGDVLPRIVGHANRDWADVATDILDSMSRTTRLVASEPQDAMLADGERVVVQSATGIYADTFGRVRFSAPVPPPADQAAALAALRAQAAEQVARMDAPARTALFLKLRQLHDAFARNVQSVFTLAAEDTVRDAGVDATTRAAAKDFLVLASGGDYYQNRLDAMEQEALQGAAPK